jgi:hypothetical protein
MKRTLLLISILLVTNVCLAQDSFSTVEERMTGKEFMEAGLNKLSESELKALNDWLRDHSVATLDSRVPGRASATVAAPTTPGAPAAVSTTAAPQTAQQPVVDKRGFEGSKSNREDIVSRLIGEFEGWDGETVFKLENGMIWKQEETDYFTTRKMVNPMVTIKSGMFGSWRLSVEGYNKKVEVVRIQ